MVVVESRVDDVVDAEDGIVEVAAVVGGAIFVCTEGDGGGVGVLCEVVFRRDTVELKTVLNGGGVKLSPDPRASSLCVGCDSGCDETGVRSARLDSVVALETGGVDAKSKGPGVVNGEEKPVNNGFAAVEGLLVFGGN